MRDDWLRPYRRCDWQPIELHGFAGRSLFANRRTKRLLWLPNVAGASFTSPSTLHLSFPHYPFIVRFIAKT